MMKQLFLTLAFFCLCALPVFAQSDADEFRIRMFFGEDLVSPTTPTGLTATPVAQTQINLSWNASTDDVLLEGYQVFRDLVQIATTSLTTYADTGLTASTTYAYHVVAFDSFYNYSSSSNSVATTTFGITPTSTPTTTDDGTSGGAKTDVTLQSLNIVPNVYSALLEWKTNRFAQFELRWGRTTSYELGFVNNEVYKRDHRTVITDLEPGTTYEYELVAYNKDGYRSVLSRSQFKTLDIPDTQAPSNVSWLRAQVNGKDVELSWQTPTDEDFSHVRIVRNYLFYPTDPYDGFIAYQGQGKSYTDKNALASREVQYYTVFSYDDKGNVSSGATVAVASSEETPPFETTDAASFDLDFEDLEFIQNGKEIGKEQLRNDLPTTVRIAYDLFPEHLKSILVTMKHPQDASRSFSFLLRVNNDKSYYQAKLAPLIDVGSYPVSLTVFDYQTRLIKQVEGVITVTGEEIHDTVLPVLFVSTEFNIFFWLVVLLALLLLLILIITGARSRHALGAAVSVGGVLVLLLSVGTFTFMHLEAARSIKEEAFLAQAGFASPFTTMWVLLLTAAIVIIMLSLKRGK